MKATLILFALVLTTCTSFARMRAILVEVTVQKDFSPTVSIYSSFENEQCLDVSIDEAAAVLERVRQPGNSLDVSVLVNGFIDRNSLWKLLDGLKKSPWAMLSYLEMDHFFAMEGKSRLSEHGAKLQASFKVPEYTKKRSP